VESLQNQRHSPAPLIEYAKYDGQKELRHAAKGRNESGEINRGAECRCMYDGR
jgi:hypothetical protein